MPGQPLLAVEDLRWTPPGRDAPLFPGLDLQVHGDEVLCIEGPSGCGKSSLLRALVLLLEDAEGTVSWLGALVGPAQVPEHRRRTALVAQDPATAVGTVDEDLEFARTMGGDHAPAPAVVDRWLTTLGLSAIDRGMPFAALSGGERRRFALVRALCAGPRILLLDEPTTGLDPDLVDTLVSLVLQWKAEMPGRALAWITHDAAQRKQVATRVHRISPGGAR